MIMETLREAETATGRMLTHNEILNIVARKMRDSQLPMNFLRWRGR